MQFYTFAPLTYCAALVSVTDTGVSEDVAGEGTSNGEAASNGEVGSNEEEQSR